MDFDLNKLIYGDLLDPDILDKLGNVDLGLGCKYKDLSFDCLEEEFMQDDGAQLQLPA